MNDLRYAWRVLVKHPGFLLTAVLTLAIGIGANTAIFSAIDTVLLRPLPFPESDRLVFVRELVGRWHGGMTVPDFLDWRREQTPFKYMAAYGSIFVSLNDGANVERWPGRRVSADYFRVLGTPPALGRDFTAQDEPLGAAKSVILSEGLWRGRFNADHSIIGRALTLNGESYTVIGVAAPEAQALREPDMFYMPLAITEAETHETGNHWMTSIARLKPGVTSTQAEAQLLPLALATQKVRPGSNGKTTIVLDSMQEAEVGSLRQPLFILLAVVGVVLSIACANVANLVLIRSVARQREVAIRTALGASRWQIVRQLLIENILLAAIGGAVGLLVARWAKDLLPLLLPDTVLRFAHPSLDWRVLAFAALLTLAVGLLFGLAPALRVSRRAPQDTLQEATRGASLSPRRHRLGASLVIAEIALALMLIVGAGLLVRSFVRLLSVDPGFKPDGVVVMQIALPEIRYREPEQDVRVFDQVLEGARLTPGVKSAGVSNAVPFRDEGYGMVAWIEGRPRPSAGGDWPNFAYRAVSPEYFAALGVPMVQGRAFSADDRAGRPRVAIINQAAARRYFPNGDAIGQHLLPDDGGDSAVEVVGIVADVKSSGLSQDVQPELFVTMAQTPGFVWRSNDRTLSLVVRTISSDPQAVVPSIRDMVRRLDSSVPTYQVMTMTRMIGESTAAPQRYMFVVTAFGSIALALAALGIYGVMTFLVRQRTHEIGVRMALGAARRDVLGLVFGRVVWLASIGLGIGLALALTLARWLGTFLFEIKPTDAMTYVLGGVVLFVVALLAAYMPAYRATRIDPVTALRVE
jgi:putative ABC transport system permease protein